MKLKVFLSVAAICAVLVFASAPAFADDRPDEGKITRVVPEARLITVQDEDGDQWDLQWNETTKMEGDATLAQLKPGDVRPLRLRRAGRREVPDRDQADFHSQELSVPNPWRILGLRRASGRGAYNTRTRIRNHPWRRGRTAPASQEDTMRTLRSLASRSSFPSF